MLAPRRSGAVAALAAPAATAATGRNGCGDGGAVSDEWKTLEITNRYIGRMMSAVWYSSKGSASKLFLLGYMVVDGEPELFKRVLRVKDGINLDASTIEEEIFPFVNSLCFDVLHIHLVLRQISGPDGVSGVAKMQKKLTDRNRRGT